jgi:tRNA (cytidine/uridine-2'-O-)-methyltransferase
VFEIVLFEPEIPPNTGNVLRLASNTGARLHLVRPLGFNLRDRQLARAGLDYADLLDTTVHDDWPACLSVLGSRRMFAVTTRGSRRYDVPSYSAGDVFVFGPETRGLPTAVLEQFPAEQRIRVPMRPGNRSLNLSNTVAIVLYEAWRQTGYAGHGAPTSRDSRA